MFFCHPQIRSLPFVTGQLQPFLASCTHMVLYKSHAGPGIRVRATRQHFISFHYGWKYFTECPAMSALYFAGQYWVTWLATNETEAKRVSGFFLKTLSWDTDTWEEGSCTWKRISVQQIFKCYAHIPLNILWKMVTLCNNNCTLLI